MYIGLSTRATTCFAPRPFAVAAAMRFVSSLPMLATNRSAALTPTDCNSMTDEPSPSTLLMSRL